MTVDKISMKLNQNVILLPVFVQLHHCRPRLLLTAERQAPFAQQLTINATESGLSVSSATLVEAEQHHRTCTGKFAGQFVIEFPRSVEKVLPNDAVGKFCRLNFQTVYAEKSYVLFTSLLNFPKASLQGFIFFRTTSLGQLRSSSTPCSAGAARRV